MNGMIIADCEGLAINIRLLSALGLMMDWISCWRVNGKCTILHNYFGLSPYGNEHEHLFSSDPCWERGHPTFMRCTLLGRNYYGERRPPYDETRVVCSLLWFRRPRSLLMPMLPRKIMSRHEINLRHTYTTWRTQSMIRLRGSSMNLTNKNFPS